MSPVERPDPEVDDADLRRDRCRTPDRARQLVDSLDRDDDLVRRDIAGDPPRGSPVRCGSRRRWSTASSR
jgi:hypothetical protein